MKKISEGKKQKSTQNAQVYDETKKNNENAQNDKEIKKYLAILKNITLNPMGGEIKILTRFSDNKAYLNEWIKLFPDSECIILNNTKELNDFFEFFKDFTPVNEEDRRRQEKVKALLDLLMNRDDL